MHLSASNIALTAYNHGNELTRLVDIGLTGIEVAPSRVWHDTWHGLTTAQVATYRRQVEGAGLQVVGLHSLLYDQPGLILFGQECDEGPLLDFMTHLSKVCRDLGGRTLIWGAGRRRGDVARAEARRRAIAFLNRLCRRVEGHGTVFCFEPLGPADDDFINTVADTLGLVTAVDHPALRVQLDAKALIENDEARPATFAAVQPYLVHFHANEPGLGVLGGTGRVDHGALGRHLRAIGYDGWVSIEQRMLNADDPLADVARSASVLRRCYGTAPVASA